MQVVAVLSLKGGVGKTTVVLGLAGAAARYGLPTLIVDLDPQANATAATQPGPTHASIADVLDRPHSPVIRAAISPSEWSDDLHVLVGSEDTERHNHPDPRPEQLAQLHRALGRLVNPGHDGRASAHLEPYSLVLIDCPPSLGRLTRSALVAADRALLVSDPSMFAVTGVQRAFEAVEDTRRRDNPRLRPLGVLINRVQTRSVEHAFRVQELRDLFGRLVLTSAIPDRPTIQQAQGACVPIQRWETPGAREVSIVFDGLLGRILRTGGQPRPGTHRPRHAADLAPEGSTELDSFDDTDFDDTDFDDTDFDDTDPSDSEAPDADLSDADLSDADLSDADLSDADLSDADRYHLRPRIQPDNRATTGSSHPERWDQPVGDRRFPGW